MEQQTAPPRDEIKFQGGVGQDPKLIALRDRILNSIPTVSSPQLSTTTEAEPRPLNVTEFVKSESDKITGVSSPLRPKIMRVTLISAIVVFFISFLSLYFTKPSIVCETGDAYENRENRRLVFGTVVIISFILSLCVFGAGAMQYIKTI
jgi:hypothetical protein